MSPICVILLVTSVSTVSHQSYPTGKDQICFSLSQVPLIEFTSSVHDLRIVLDPLSLKANTTMVNVMISTRWTLRMQDVVNKLVLTAQVP